MRKNSFMALDWRTLLVRRMHTVTASDSETSLKVFEGKHTWTIRNWKDWINCSEDSKKSTIYSDVFTIPVCNGEATRWQILAFAKRNVKTNKDYLAFRPGFIFVRAIFVPKGKCSPFLELTPKL